MKKIIVLCMLLAAGYQSFCQASEMKAFEKQRVQFTKNGMLVLGGWSVANVITGAIGSGTSKGQMHYFHQMNMFWGGINLVFAGLGYWSASKEKADGISLTSVLQHQNKMAKTFLFNAGLDVAYVTAGLYLTERGKQETNPDKLKGYGNSIMIQGAGLLLFDGIMYLVHNKHGKQLDKFTDKVSVLASPTSVLVVVRL
jgi:hypothetical protein